MAFEEDVESSHPGPASRIVAMPSPLSVRTRLAMSVGAIAAATSRRFRGGEGMVIGGRIAARLAPQALAQLAGERVLGLVSATNGKSSTTRLLATAVEQLGPVTTQSTGANMTDGVVAALSSGDLNAPAVLEVDEAYLPQVLAATRARAVILGNLSRDQLDRMNEVAMLARTWRAMIASAPHRTTFVVNCDDPIVTWAARDARSVIWVAAGQNWTADAGVCLECGALMEFDDSWSCTECDFARPQPHWRFIDDNGTYRAEAHGRTYPLLLGLPGWFNAANATLALAAATDVLGLNPDESVQRMATVHGVSGRYEVRRIGDVDVRLLLAKNPSSWTELLTVLPPAPTPVIVSINANDADGRDPSWLWDVPFERLRGRVVIASGNRRLDLAVRLAHAGVEHVVVADPFTRANLPESAQLLDHIDCAATYTAFHDYRTRADAQERSRV
jgi:lipid II isoglutaminyl synthase (glutamine-hydrolysing)